MDWVESRSRTRVSSHRHSSIQLPSLAGALGGGISRVTTERSWLAGVAAPRIAGSTEG